MKVMKMQEQRAREKKEHEYDEMNESQDLEEFVVVAKIQLLPLPLRLVLPKLMKQQAVVEKRAS